MSGDHEQNTDRATVVASGLVLGVLALIILGMLMGGLAAW